MYFAARTMTRGWRTELQIRELVDHLVLNPGARVAVCSGTQEKAEGIIAEVKRRLATFGVVNPQLFAVSE